MARDHATLRVNGVDRQKVAAEIESVARGAVRAVRSLPTVAILHGLKLAR